MEGQVNRLKTIKRQMYGKAGFHLLRKRVVMKYGYLSPKVTKNRFAPLYPLGKRTPLIDIREGLPLLVFVNNCSSWEYGIILSPRI